MECNGVVNMDMYIRPLVPRPLQSTHLSLLVSPIARLESDACCKVCVRSISAQQQGRCDTSPRPTSISTSSRLAMHVLCQSRCLPPLHPYFFVCLFVSQSRQVEQGRVGSVKDARSKHGLRTRKRKRKRERQ